ncbi:hypothetical protein [Paenarthrobacter sp. PH39-S1]|uniref:hypothetical protein n=1 Tax=Paenarthrobacter sp. PH39-S1 TaxID=3046204 RepID=UPI0024B90B8D|nr:hypothetical protein [Paenarthrobacter sp. PH39-S1]MDJ0357087.1 hypothetical protein [Paenarthrobacter sp. PH39-S1]
MPARETGRLRPRGQIGGFAQLAGGGPAEQVAQPLTDAIILGVLAPARLPSEA